MLIFFIIIILVSLVEIYFRQTWNPNYFRFGIPLYKKTYRLGIEFRFPSIGILDKKFKSSLFPSLIFNVLSECEMAFRETQFQIAFIHYPKIIHAYLKYNKKNKSLELQCKPNFTFLSVLIFIGCPVLFNLIVSLMSNGFSENFISIIGMLCLFLFAVAIIIYIITKAQITLFKQATDFIIECSL